MTPLAETATLSQIRNLKFKLSIATSSIASVHTFYSSLLIFPFLEQKKSEYQVTFNF